MPVQNITLRSVKGSALTHSEVDKNFSALRDAINAVMQLQAVALNPDGTLKANSVGTTAIQDGSVTAAKLAAGAVVTQVGYFWHNPGSGAAGGTFNSGAWRTRLLNNSSNGITGASLDTGTGRITLPAGTYRVIAHGVGHAVQGHQSIIRNVSGDAVSVDGTMAWSSDSDDVNTLSTMEGRFTLATGSVIELQSQCTQSKATDGFGKQGSFGTPNIYASVFIEKEI